MSLEKQTLNQRSINIAVNISSQREILLTAQTSLQRLVYKNWMQNFLPKYSPHLGCFSAPG